MQNGHSPVHNKSKMKSCCSCCISPRIELVIWASISLSFTVFMLIFMFFGIMFIDAMGGDHHSLFEFEDFKMVIFTSALLTDIVYNVLVMVASLGKKVKLLKISFFLGVVMCGILCSVAAVVHMMPSSSLFHELRMVWTVFGLLMIVIRGYMLLIMRGVMSDLQDHSQTHEYIGLGKTNGMRMDNEPPI
ncbi:uncharacterized protein LOC133525992 [Cydia pomonella]|uniref:uncharacterized protein LOC133525992 n=1 Tax=Cydia pomonella TaxID=82600 RepID=UPI002ADDE290|nr:uncharacterized protein LOC133525992 [Cydia pomonella]